MKPWWKQAGFLYALSMGSLAGAFVLVFPTMMGVNNAATPFILMAAGIVLVFGIVFGIASVRAV